MAKPMDCNKVVGFVGGKNTRDAWPWLDSVKIGGTVGAVMFRSELTGEEDQRTVIFDLVYGKDATEETRKAVVKLVQTNDSNGPDSQWALMNLILKDQQREPCQLTIGDQGPELLSGARRWFANVLGHILLSDHKDQIPYEIYEGSTEAAQELGHTLNSSHKALSPVDEGKRYYEMYNNLGMTDKAIAERLEVLDKAKKPNSQRVRMMRRLWDERVKPEWRDQIRAGTRTVDSVIKFLDGTRNADAPGKADSRPRVMTYKAAEPFTEIKNCRTLVATEQISKKFADKEGAERDAAIFQYAFRLATQKDELPAKVMEAVFPKPQEDAADNNDGQGEAETPKPKKKGRKPKNKTAPATPADTEGAPEGNAEIAV